MFYLDDIIELIEDVPDELQRRGGLIQDWDRQAAECKKEADRLTARLHNDNSLRDDEKANVFRQISESLEKARDAAQKKSDMAAKCHRLVEALSERVSEYAYHCKLELEVDAPGCTAPIERSFMNESAMAAAAAINSRTAGIEFRVPIEKPAPPPPASRDRVGSSSTSISRESTPAQYGMRMNERSRRTRDSSSMSSSRASSTQPMELQPAAVRQMQQRDRKRKRDRERRERERAASQFEQQQARAAAAPAISPPSSKDAPMSAYMRKKKEREREERKLREVHANRERTSQQRVIKAEPLDDGYDSQSSPAATRPRTGPGRPPGSRLANSYAPVAQPQSRRGEEQQPKEEPVQQAEPDTHTGGMSDLDDEDLLRFLHDEMPGGIADHEELNLGLEDENLFDMASFGADLGKALEKIQKERPPSPLGQNIYGYSNAPTKSSAAGGSGSSRYSNKVPSKADLKHQQSARQFISFGAGESMHGRQRKMTHRADIYAGDLDAREAKRRQIKKETDTGEYSGGGGSTSREMSLASDLNGQQGMDDAEDNDPYCYCRRPSEGEMVGCDGKDCRWGGWFHLSCLAMTAPPAQSKWYCDSCVSRRR